MRKALLLLICLMAAVLLTACYTNPDPWPAGSDNVQTQVTAAPTQAPATDPTTDGGQIVEQTAQPGGEEAPGLNGRQG